MQEYRNPLQGIGSFFRSGSALSILILVNVAVWLVISFVRVPLFLSRVPDESLSNFILEWFALPADPDSILSRPWTPITYMFLHIEFLHILFNMLWLYWFGKIFLEFLSTRRLIFTYILGGLAGGLLYVIFYNTFPVFEYQRSVSFALGASAAVMAIVSTISFYNPNYSVYFVFIGKVRIIFIFAILFVLDFFMIRSGNSGGHIAHIGGAIFGIVYATWIRHAFNLRELGDAFRPGRTLRIRPFDHGKDERRTRRKERPVRAMTDEEYNVMKAEREKKLNEILEKISKSGYESLSRAEREFLSRESQK